MQTIRIMVVNEEGTLLDSVSVEIEDSVKAVGYRLLRTEFSPRGDEESLAIGTGPHRGE